MQTAAVDPFHLLFRERETKRTFTRALKQAKVRTIWWLVVLVEGVLASNMLTSAQQEDFGALEVEEEETPPKKAPKIPNQQSKDTTSLG